MPTIACPHCHQSIDVDQVLAHQLESQLKERYQAALNRETTKIKHTLTQETEMKIREELAAKQQKQLTDLQTQLRTQQERAEKAEKQELDLLKQQRELAEEKKRFQLEIERKLNERLHEEQEKAVKIEADRFQLKEQEYQKQIADMKKLVEEATRKAHTVSQQLQGEVQELALEQLLQTQFPQDEVAEVKKGQLGADLLHTVKNTQGKTVGLLVWESKQTEKFADKWLAKLREDCRAVQGTMAVLVTRSLPPDIKVCGERDRVWITNVEFALPLAHLLRQTLLRVDQERLAQSGKDVKMELLYHYVNSNEFRGRVEGIVESFQEMNDDLEREQRAMQNLWKKRQMQLKRLAINTAYMYGEMQGVVGASLPGIAGLELTEGKTGTPSTHTNPSPALVGSHQISSQNTPDDSGDQPSFL